MAGRASRVGLVAVAWAASALLAAYLLAPWFAPAAIEGLGPGGTAAEPPRRATPPLAGLAEPAGGPERPDAPAWTTAGLAGEGASESTRPPSTEPAPPATRADPATPLAGGPEGRLRVHVTCDDGTPAAGVTVYALPAGAPGADDGDGLYTVDCDDEGHAEMALPGGVLLDVGAVGGGAGAMERDVRLEPGGAREVRLALHRGRPIELTIEFATPVPPQWRNQLQVTVRDEGPEQGVHHVYPGRDERPSLWAFTVRFDGEGRATTAPVVEGNRYRVDARHLQHIASQLAGATNVEYAAEPPVAGAGGRIAVRVRRQAELALRVAVPPALQGGSFGLTAWLVDGAGNRFVAILNATGAQVVGRPAPDVPLVIPAGVPPAQAAAAQQAWEQRRAAQKPIEWPVVVPVPSQATRLAWQGGGLRAGDSGPLTFAAGQRLDYVIRLEPPAADGAEAAAEPASERRLLLSGPRPADADDASCYVYLLRGDATEAESLDFTWDEPTIAPDAGAARPRGPAIAVASGLLASVPFEFPEAGDIPVELRPAGLLLVVDAAALANPAGPVVELERADGAPIPFSEEIGNLDFDGWQRGLSKAWTAWEAHRRVAGRLAAVLGPFPAGAVEFVVRRGGFPAGRVRGTVVAGQIRPLVIGP